MAQYDAETRETIRSVMMQVETSLKAQSPNLRGSISVLPLNVVALQRDQLVDQAQILDADPNAAVQYREGAAGLRGDSDEYCTGVLKNAVTNAGLNYVEGRNDPVWFDILREIEWDQRKQDMLDPATLSAFGRLQATQNIMYGVVRDVGRIGNNQIYVELELHISSILTKQHLWGEVFTERYYIPSDQQGIVQIDQDVKKLLKSTIDKGVLSLKSAPNLVGVKTIAISTLAGDIDGYITGLIENMISETSYVPRRLAANTKSETVQLLRNNPSMADAVLFGSVRNLSRKFERASFGSETYELLAEVQLRIQDAKTQDVLWSANLSGEDFVEEKATLWELFLMNQRWIMWILGGLIGSIFLLFLFRSFLKAVTRVR